MWAKLALEIPLSDFHLSTPRLDLIPASLEMALADANDLPALARMLEADPPALWPIPMNDAHSQAFMIDYLRSNPGSRWAMWYFVCREPKRIIVGNGGFTGDPSPEGVVEVGYSIAAEHQCRGYATEALFELLRFAFSHAAVTMAIAHTYPELRASQRVLEKCGFELAGKGSEERTIRYSLPRTIWRASRDPR